MFFSVDDDKNLYEIIKKKEKIREERLQVEEKFIYKSPFLNNAKFVQTYYSEFIFHKTKDDYIPIFIEPSGTIELLKGDLIIEHYKYFHRVYVVKNIKNELRLINTHNYNNGNEKIENDIIKIVNFRCI